MNSFFVAQQGETYYIAISGPQGLFDLEWPTVQFPDNDMVANAIPFSSSTGGSLDYGASAALTVYNYGASKESFEQTVFNNSVWTKLNRGPTPCFMSGWNRFWKARSITHRARQTKYRSMMISSIWWPGRT